MFEVNDDLESLSVLKHLEIKYPCVVIENITALNQVSPFIEKNIDNLVDLILVPMYGIKNNEPKYIGDMLLISSNILRLQYMGLNVLYYESEDKHTDFNTDNEIINICASKELINYAHSFSDNHSNHFPNNNTD